MDLISFLFVAPQKDLHFSFLYYLQWWSVFTLASKKNWQCEQRSNGAAKATWPQWTEGNKGTQPDPKESKLDSFLNYMLPHRTRVETIQCTYSRKLLLVEVEHPDKDTAFLRHSIFLWDTVSHSPALKQRTFKGCAFQSSWPWFLDLCSILEAAQTPDLSNTQLSAQRLQWEHSVNFPDIAKR